MAAFTLPSAPRLPSRSDRVRSACRDASSGSGRWAKGSRNARSSASSRAVRATPRMAARSAIEPLSSPRTPDSPAAVIASSGAPSTPPGFVRRPDAAIGPIRGAAAVASYASPLRFGIAAENREPTVAVANRATGRAGERAADVDRRMRFLHGLWPGVNRIEIDVVAVILRLILRPDLLHRFDPFPHHAKPPVERRAVVFDFLGVPPPAHTEEKASPRNHVDAGDVLGGLDRISLHDEADAGRQQQPIRHRGGGRQADEGIEDVVVHLGNRVAAGPLRRSMHRDVRVLRKPQRLEAALFGRPCDFDGSGGIVRRENGDAVLHDYTTSRGAWGTSFQKCAS